MKDFKRVPRRKGYKINTLYGHGINDADYQTEIRYKDGSRDVCPSNRTWRNMIRRCYSSVTHSRQPYYKGITVCEEWLTFSNFDKWFLKNYIDGYDLDKDILNIGNIVYSPNSCIFITPRLNAQVTDWARRDQDCPQGVHFDKSKNAFIASIRIDGKLKTIKRCSTPEEAYEIYKPYKRADMIRLINLLENRQFVKDAMFRHADLYL